MYEVEFKVEITEEESNKLRELFAAQGFEAKAPVTQNDFYIEAEKSPFGAYDIKRYRDEGDKIFYTEKVWEIANGEKARREIEREAMREEFDVQIPKHPDTLKIQKERQSYKGLYEERELHIDMDTIQFDHSPNIRYFIEVEVLSSDKEGIKELKESLIEFLRQSLGRTEILESPGMFTMAFEKR